MCYYNIIINFSLLSVLYILPHICIVNTLLSKFRKYFIVIVVEIPLHNDRSLFSDRPNVKSIFNTIRYKDREVPDGNFNSLY